MRINEDGNVLGRMMAMAIIIVAVVCLARICGVSQCPLSAMTSCEAKASPAQPAQ